MPNTLTKPRSTTVTLKLNAVSRDRLKSLAATKKRTPHFLMKEAIERYLKVEEAQQAIMQSVDESIAHFETTGLHVTLEEVRSWSKAQESNPSAKLPICHL
jgi:predicted transcriptional regulator